MASGLVGGLSFRILEYYDTVAQPRNELNITELR